MGYSLNSKLRIFLLSRLLTVILFILAILLLPEVNAASVGCNPAVEICNPITSGTFTEVMKNIAETAAKIGLPIVGIFMIYAGFLFVSARGSEEQIEKAKRTFFWAVIGGALVIGAFAIATAIENFAKQL
jgi:amino acid transporter